MEYDPDRDDLAAIDHDHDGVLTVDDFLATLELTEYREYA